MNVRKQRTHQCGLTNVDYRTKGDQGAVDRYNPSLKFADTGTMNKHGFKQMGLKVNDPKDETAQEFYNAQGKTAKAPVLVANRKTQQLEDPKWTDKIFTGDNAKTTAKLAHDAGKRDLTANPNKVRGLSESVIVGPAQRVEADILRRQQEAANEPLTLEQTVDKKHVMDIRRALRRKYASRANLHRIFQQWDRGTKGGISVQDLFYGLNKVNLTTTLDQATALHSMATQIDQDPNLCLQEFSDLLFGADENFSANLMTIPATDKQEETTLMESVLANRGNKTLDLATLAPESLEKLRKRNHWRQVLQNNLTNISKDLLTGDDERTYLAEPRELMRVLDRRMSMTTAQQNDREDLHDYLLMFQDEASGKIRYREMANDLRGFNYDKETNEGVIPRSANSISSGRRSYFGAIVQRNVFDDGMTVLDSQHVPTNKLDQIERHLIKVNRVLQEKFKTQANFEQYLREKADADKNGNISVDEMKAMIADTCTEEVTKRRLTKHDLEGFLSSFKYTVHGATDISTIAPLVFEKDSNKLALALSCNKRTNPPPANINEELAAGGDDGDISNETTARRLRGILGQIENHHFCSGKPRAFEIFRAFDTDGDGFVSYKDFEANLLKNKIFASKGDISLLMKNVLDTDGNGYIDFSTFKDKFGPDMSRLIAVPERELHMPNLVPNKEKLNEFGQRSTAVRASVYKVRETFQPEIDAKLVPATRFGAKPSHPNTFLNHNAGPNTPGYITENNRFGGMRSNRNLQTKCDFQQEEKVKKQKLQESKVRDKQVNVDKLHARLDMMDQDKDARATAKMLFKASNYDTYEKINHF